MKIGIVCLLMLLMLDSLAQDRKAGIALFPQQNAFRNTLNLSGIWKFKQDPSKVGEQERWFNGLEGARNIAVPGSWNDQFTDIRDYLGMGWYEMETFVPSAWKGERIILRIGSATYFSRVWINGEEIGQHEGGNLPFAFEIGEFVRWDEPNRVTVMVENELSPARVPTGNVQGGLFTNFPASNYDFFPYAGIHRDVYLYSVPQKSSIKDITLKTSFEGNTGMIEATIEVEGATNVGEVKVTGAGKDLTVPFTTSNGRAVIEVTVPDVRLWSPDDPYLYGVTVSLGRKGKTVDEYRLETGIRTVSVNEKSLLLNGKPILLKGFGKHEDFPIIGRGSLAPVIVKDFSLMKWVGANSFRTSHYPYDEEFMRMADREGFLVINEIPAVGLFFHGDSTEMLRRHERCKQYIDELIERDKNHPSVIMWCVANEPFPKNIGAGATPEDRAATPRSIELFQELIGLVKEKDDTRLATLVGVMGGPKEWLGLCDIICVNRYYGWYTHTGDMEGAMKLLDMELEGLHKLYKKPIIVTEFGADTYPGMHSIESEMYSEEFQVEFLRAYIDWAAKKDYVAGMHVWAFSDFKTGQALIRFGAMNYKGVFTRDRKPKAAAHYLRSIWYKE